MTRNDGGELPPWGRRRDQKVVQHVDRTFANFNNFDSGKDCAHTSLSMFPRTAIVGAMALSCFSTSGVPTSPE